MISAENPRASGVGDGSNPNFTYSFKIFLSSDLLVYVDDLIQTLNVHYTVQMNSDGVGGTVVFETAYIPDIAEVVDIVRSIPLTQETNIQEGDRFPASVVNNSLDKMTMILQDINSMVSLLVAGGTGTPVPVNTVLAMLGYKDVRQYSSINQAISTLGSTVCTLFIPNAQTLTASLTIPSTMNVIIAKGGSIVKASTYTVTFNGKLEAGPYQIFSGFSAGDVTFAMGAVKECYAEWWAANTTPGTTDMTTAVQCAENSHAKLVLLNTDYNVTAFTEDTSAQQYAEGSALVDMLRSRK